MRVTKPKKKCALLTTWWWWCFCISNAFTINWRFEFLTRASSSATKKKKKQCEIFKNRTSLHKILWQIKKFHSLCVSHEHTCTENRLLVTCYWISSNYSQKKMQQKLIFPLFIDSINLSWLHLSHQSVTMAHRVCYSWIIDSFKVHEISITICLTRWWWKIISMLMSLTQLVWHFSILWAAAVSFYGLPFTMKFKNIRRNYEEKW